MGIVSIPFQIASVVEEQDGSKAITVRLEMMSRCQRGALRRGPEVEEILWREL